MPEIAILDGLDAIQKQFDPREGALYGGGSSFPDSGRLPLLPSTIGLAGARLRRPQGVPSVPLVAERMPRAPRAFDPREGGMYGGGSCFPDSGRLPLLPSTVGLAGDMADSDLLQEYNRLTSGLLPARRKVISPGQGALYTGGSSFAPRMPLVTSNAGLAAADAQAINPRNLNPMQRAMFQKWASPVRLRALKEKAAVIRRKISAGNPTLQQRANAQTALNRIGNEVNRIRALRRVAAQS